MKMTQRELQKQMREDGKRMNRGQKPIILPSIGGFARAASLGTIRRSESARNAVKARWKNASVEYRRAHGAMLAAARARKRKKPNLSETRVDSTERPNMTVA
jgi:hypothetical protein